MSKAEILAELPKLQPNELAEIQAKLDELTGEDWSDHAQSSGPRRKATPQMLLRGIRNSAQN